VLAIGRQNKGPTVAGDIEFHDEIRRGQQAGGLVRPFDQADAVGIEVVAKTGVFPFVRVGKTIKIEMVGSQPRQRVAFHQRIGRALHPTAVTERGKKAAR